MRRRSDALVSRVRALTSPWSTPCGRRHTLAWLLALLTLVVAACGGSTPPDEQLAAAFEDTFGEPFAFEIQIEADGEALRSLGDQAGQTASFLAGLAVEGTIDGDATALTLRVLGREAFELRQLGEDSLYVRAGVVELLDTLGAGPALADRLKPRLEELNLDPAVTAAVDAALSGRWVGVDGAIDLAALGAAAGTSDEPDPDQAREAFGSDLPGFFDQFVDVDQARASDGGTRFDVGLRLRDLLRTASAIGGDLGFGSGGAAEGLEDDLAELPETVPGRVLVSDGRVTAIVFDIAEAGRQFGADLPGAIDLRFEVTASGNVPSVAPPDDAVLVESEALLDALDRLATLLEGSG